MNLGNRNKIKIEAGTASMTDLVFLLLIFFIIISLTASNNHTPVDLPKPADKLTNVQDPVGVTVIVTDDNKYMLFGEQIEQARDFDIIKEQVASEVNNSGKMKLKIAGHKLANYEAVFKVLALCQANGWEPVLAYQK
jgi:biopolymer transport protein ExbD